MDVTVCDNNFKIPKCLKSSWISAVFMFDLSTLNFTPFCRNRQ